MVPQKQCSGSRLHIEITKAIEKRSEDWINPSSYNSENKPDHHGKKESLHQEDEEYRTNIFNKVGIKSYKLHILYSNK